MHSPVPLLPLPVLPFLPVPLPVVAAHQAVVAEGAAEEGGNAIQKALFTSGTNSIMIVLRAAGVIAGGSLCHV